MTWVEVLVEGKSDEPVLREVLTRKCNLHETLNFQIHAHRGKGALPKNPLQKPDVDNRTLLHQLPAKLRAYAKSLRAGSAVVVVVDVDNESPALLLEGLEQMLKGLAPLKIQVLFCLAIEETESWFIADPAAVKSAFPKADVGPLKKLTPDGIVGAWERLAEALGSSGATGADKLNWATRISPHLNLDQPASPSLRKVIEQLAAALKK